MSNNAISVFPFAGATCPWAGSAVSCPMTNGTGVPDVPKMSIFSSEVRSAAHRSGRTFASLADELFARGVSGFDSDFRDPGLPEFAASAIKPASLYGFIDFCAADGGREACDAFVAAAVEYGVPRIMCLPTSFTDGRENEAELLKILAGLRYLVAAAAKADVKVMVEDFGGPENPCSYAKNLKRFLTEIPDLRFALDSGNLLYAGRGDDILEMMRFAAGRIEHVHLKDQPKDAPRSYVTLGLGAVPNARIVRAMRAGGYDGWFTLECLVGDDLVEDVVRQIAAFRYWYDGAK